MNDPVMPSAPMTFSNGLLPEHDDAIDELMINISSVILSVEALGRHRSYALAITHLEEARHWLRDRKHKAA